MTRTRIAVAVVVAAAALAASLVALLGGRSARIDPPAAGIGIAATVTPRAALFGDPLEARVEALVDRRAVDPRSLRLDGSFGRYSATAPPLVTRTDTGPLTRVVYRYRLQCLALQCLTGEREMVVLAPLRLSFTRRKGSAGAQLVRWPAVEVASRLTPADIALLTPIDQPPFHATMAVPGPSYALSPTLLVALLAAGAALLLTAAGLVAVRFIPARAPAAVPEPPPQPVEPVRVVSPLERALHLLERARDRGIVPEQRKALEHLAGELRRSGERDLARSATVLAWAERPPGTDATGALAAAVQRRIAKGVNGHGAD